MIVHEPIPHWNNFTVPELKEILEHCRALERLGIAQDAEMMVSIERDLAIRKEKTNEHYMPFEPRHAKTGQQTGKQSRIKINKRQKTLNLLEQNV